jgi:hypothetical protein
MARSDPESTAMMMKDGVTIRPGYNLEIASENGIVVGYDVSNNSNDSMSFKPVLDDARSTVGTKPTRRCAPPVRLRRNAPEDELGACTSVPTYADIVERHLRIWWRAEARIPIPAASSARDRRCRDRERAVLLSLQPSRATRGVLALHDDGCPARSPDRTGIALPLRVRLETAPYAGVRVR